MRSVKSCGVLVFRREPELSFLLMKHPTRYDLPKGHIKKRETELECALRELEEETGLSAEDVQLVEGFRFTSTYYPRYARFGNETVEKTVVMLLGWLVEERAIAVSEHEAHEWVTWNPPHEFGVSTIDDLLVEAGPLVVGN